MPKRFNVKVVPNSSIEKLLDEQNYLDNSFRNTILKISITSYEFNNGVTIGDKGFDPEKEDKVIRPKHSDFLKTDNYIDLDSWLNDSTSSFSEIESNLVIKYNFYFKSERITPDNTPIYLGKSKHGELDGVKYTHLRCDLDTKTTWGGSCPLTCCVRSHGIDICKNYQENIEEQDKDALYWHYKTKKKTQETTKSTFQGTLEKLGTYLKDNLPKFNKLGSNLIQTIAGRVYTAYKNFWDVKHSAGFPQFHRKENSLDIKSSDLELISRSSTRDERNPRNKALKDKAKIELKDSKYGYFKIKGSALHKFPEFNGGIKIKFFDSWKNQWEGRRISGATLFKDADGYYLSVVVSDSPEEFEKLIAIENVESAIGVDLGINKLAALSNGKFIENKRFGTNKKTRARLVQLDKALSKAAYGSKNYIKLRKLKNILEKRIRDSRNTYNWQVANRIVKLVDAVVFEALKILNMVKRAKKVKSEDGKGYAKNGQCRKAGLNKVILDAAWGDLKAKCLWLCKKLGKHFIEVNPKNTSRKCPECGHTHADNRDGEKFICVECGYTKDADTVGSINIVRRAGFKWKRKKPLKAKTDSKGQLLLPIKVATTEVVKPKRKRSKKQQQNHVQLSLF